MLEARTTSRYGDVMLGWVDVETGALILSADRDGLREFVSWLRNHTRDTISLGEAQSWPMARPIHALGIHLAGEAVAIEVANDVGRFAGSGAGYERLAHQVELFAEDGELEEPGSHAHFDPDDGSGAQHVLAVDSCPLIVVGPVPGEAATIG
jgi:hypothetical protein